LVVAAICLFLWGSAVGARLFDLHVVKAAHYRELASEQHLRELDIHPQRGAIRDRSGNDLAISIEVDSLYAQPAKVEKPRQTADFLSAVLGIPADALLGKLTDDRPFVWLKRKITAAQSAQIRSADLPGVDFLHESKRFYPNVRLAAHVLGPVNLDNHGVGGIEYYYDELIAGTPGRVVEHRDARNVTFERLRQSPTEGASLTTTLDMNVQHFVEEEVDRTVRETGAVGMSVIVMDPTTGGILAMANHPTFNPNDYARFPEINWSNRAIKYVYEPGSTFKIATAAAVLEEGLGDIDEIVDGKNGSIVVHGFRIRDHKPFGLLTLREVIEYSSNVGMIQFGSRIGDSLFADYIERFGFGKRTGIDLMGEEKGFVRPSGQWSGLSSSVISIGQEVSATALQVLNLTAAVGNGGVLYRPYVVRRVDHVDGTVEETRPEGRRVMTTKTATLLQDALSGVVTDGTGQSGAIPGFTAAGKTGTAQKFDVAMGRYSDTRYVASFAGYAPATSPRIAVVVVIDEPRGGYHGGEVAAPAFGRLAGEILRYMGVEPDALRPAPRYSEDGDADLPSVPGSWRRQDASVPSQRGWQTVNASISPMAGRAGVENVLDAGRFAVPDYFGQPLRAVFGDTARLGLRLISSGSGVAVGQWPPPGALVPSGTAIDVRFSTTLAGEFRPHASVP
jgi:cell division protein FtsI (penicillin-binding protein 3)